MANKEIKTNVMRILDSKKIEYQAFDYTDSGVVSGEEVSEYLNIPKSQTFKTLVTVGKSGAHYVFDIPVDCELDLKKAANSVDEKNIQMIKSKELLGLTGYIHGGCSPIGMKKFFTTTFDNSVSECQEIYFSGGKIGAFVKIKTQDLQKAIRYSIADITVSK